MSPTLASWYWNFSINVCIVCINTSYSNYLFSCMQLKNCLLRRFFLFAMDRKKLFVRHAAVNFVMDREERLSHRR